MLLSECQFFFFFWGGGGGGSVFSPNVNLQSILNPQQIYKEQNWSEDCVIRRRTKTQVRILCRPITAFYEDKVKLSASVEALKQVPVWNQNKPLCD